MTGPFVHLREEVHFVDGGRLHLPGGGRLDVGPLDQALVELSMRGEAEIELLLDRLAEAVCGVDRPALREALVQNLGAGDAVLEICDGPRVDDPDVIVCDLAPEASPFDSTALVAELRRALPGRTVLLVGGDAGPRRATRRHVTLEGARRSGAVSGWFQFVQWVRGLVRCCPRASVVLTGPQDAILLGDLVQHARAAVVVEPSWPQRAGLGSLRGGGWLPEDPYDVLPSLFYALRFGPHDELATWRRESCGDFAVLEGLALRDADLLLTTAADQGPLLTELGRDPATLRWCHGMGASPVSAPAASADTLLLVGDDALGLDPVARVAAAVDGPLRGGEVRIVLRAPRWDLEVAPDAGGLGLRSVERVPAERVRGALVLPELVRILALGVGPLGDGFPAMIDGALPRHPLVADAPDELRADAATWARRMVAEVATPTPAQAAFVERTSLAGQVLSWLAARREAVPC